MSLLLGVSTILNDNVVEKCMSILITYTSGTLENMDHSVDKDNRRQSYRSFFACYLESRCLGENFLSLEESFALFKPSLQMRHDSRKNSTTRSFLPHLICRTYLYPSLSLSSLRPNAFDRERFTKFMEAIPPRLDLDFSATGSTRGRPSCVGDHDVSLASCLPKSTWHRHDHCLPACLCLPVFCDVSRRIRNNLCHECPAPSKELNLPNTSLRLIPF